MAMSKAKKANFHLKIMQNWNNIWAVEQHQRRVMNEDTLVANVQGGTWIDGVDSGSGYLDGDVYRDDESPRFAVNKIAYELQKSQGTYLNMRPQISVAPDGMGATKEGAEALQALIKHIEQQSDADNAYDAGFNANQTCGFGAWKIKTGYKDDGFEQEVWIDAIPDAVNTLFFDALSTPQILNQDARHLFYIEHISLEEHKQRWPRAAVSSFDNTADLSKDTTIDSAWYQGNTVAVAQYWYKEPYVKRIGETLEGEVIEFENRDEEREAIPLLATYSNGKPKVRSVESNRVKMVMINGLEILEGAFDFPSEYFPFVPDYGIVTTVQGTNYIRGRVRLAKDAQRIDDYAVSKFIETTAIQPEQPILTEAEMIDGFESEWEAQPLPPILRFNAVASGNQPRRLESAQISPALIQQIGQAERDIQAAMGVVNDQEIQQLSGVSYRAQVAQSNLGTAINRDNHRKAVELTGKILADVAPSIYDYETVITFISEEGETKEVPLNTQVRNPQTAEMAVENNLKEGRYNITAVAGLDGLTQKSELSEKLASLAATSPEIAAITPDIQAELLDAPKHISDKLQKRIRKLMIQQGLDTPTEEEAQELEIDMGAIEQQKMATEQANQALIMQESRLKAAQAAKAEEEAFNKAAATDKLVSDNQGTMLDNRMKVLEQIQKKIELGAQLTQNDAMLVYGTTDIVLDDMADSVEERQQMAQSVQQQMQALQTMQATQAQQPIARSPEQSVQSIQMQDAGLVR